MKILGIISPVYGTISDIGPDTITIAIKRQDIHTVYAPISGILVDISDYHGSWKRQIFQAQVNKLARTILSIRNPLIGTYITFWLEVGKPKYVTDRIQIDKNINDKVKQGEQMGKIILGSVAEVHFNHMYHYNLVKVGSIVEGGKTIISYIIELNDKEKYNLLDQLLQKVSPNDINEIFKNYLIEEKLSQDQNYSNGTVQDDKNNNLKQLIVLTTPHETCAKIDGHNCDTYALKLANQFKKSLSNKDRDVIIFHGDVNRTKVDLNRAESFYTPFRQEIREKILYKINEIKNSSEISSNNIIYLLDCHSFPNDDPYQNVRISNPDVAILFADCNQLLLTEELTDIFKDNNIKAVKLLASRDDIINEFIDLKYKYISYKIDIIPILIEINESVSNEKLEMVGESISRWIDIVNKYIMNQLSK